MRSIRALIGTNCAEQVWITDRWEAWLDEDGMAGESRLQGLNCQDSHSWRLPGVAW